MLQRTEDLLVQRLGHRAAGRPLDDEPREDVVRVVVLPLFARGGMRLVAHVAQGLLGGPDRAGRASVSRSSRCWALPTPPVWLSSMRSVMRSAFGQSDSARLSGSSSLSRPSCASLTASAPTNIFVIEKIGNGVSAVTGARVSRLARPEAKAALRGGP